MMDMEDIEDAIWDWVKRSSGLDDNHIIWAHHHNTDGANVPSGTYISLSFGDDDSVGDMWSGVTDEEDAGGTIAMTGIVTLQLLMECFCGTDTWAQAQPRARLRSVINALSLPSGYLGLRAANVGIGPVGPIQQLSLQRSGIFEPRAQVEITLHLIDTVSEAVDIIETVEAELDIKSGDTVIDTVPIVSDPTT